VGQFRTGKKKSEECVYPQSYQWLSIVLYTWRFMASVGRWICVNPWIGFAC